MLPFGLRSLSCLQRKNEKEEITGLDSAPRAGLKKGALESLWSLVVTKLCRSKATSAIYYPAKRPNEKGPEERRKAVDAIGDPEVERLAAANTPTRLIAIKTNRSEAAIRSIAARKGIYIRPANQSLNKRGNKP